MWSRGQQVTFSFQQHIVKIRQKILSVYVSPTITNFKYYQNHMKTEYCVERGFVYDNNYLFRNIKIKRRKT